MSHLCDRLSQLAEEQVSHQVSIAGLTDALIEEQAFRQDFEEAVRAEIKHAPCRDRGIEAVFLRCQTGSRIDIYIYI